MKMIDHFIAPQCFAEEGLLYKMRLLIGIIFAYITFITIFVLFFISVPGMDKAERLAGAIPSTFVGLSFVAILSLLKSQARFRLSAHSMVAVTYLGILAGTLVTGGPFVTPSGPMLIVPVFLAFCLLELVDGIIWAAIVFTVHISTMIMSVYGYEFMMVTAEDMQGTAVIFNWVMAFITLVALMIIYEIMNRKLRQERDTERAKYQHVITIASDSSVVQDSARKLSENGLELLDSTLQQKTAIEELSVTTEELSTTATRNSERASAALKDVVLVEQHIHHSDRDIINLIQAMAEIERLSDEIRHINDVINDISYQTNLLSLNAMIEASRAGDEHGGFKVVALEVKKLAERSATAAESIKGLLINNKEAVDQGVSLSASIKSRFSDINAAVKPMSETLESVSNASHEQSDAIRQIVTGLIHINAAIEQNSELASNASSMSAQLQEISSALNEAIAAIYAD